MAANNYDKSRHPLHNTADQIVCRVPMNYGRKIEQRPPLLGPLVDRSHSCWPGRTHSTAIVYTLTLGGAITFTVRVTISLLKLGFAFFWRLGVLGRKGETKSLERLNRFAISNTPWLAHGRLNYLLAGDDLEETSVWIVQATNPPNVDDNLRLS